MLMVCVVILTAELLVESRTENASQSSANGSLMISISRHCSDDGSSNVYVKCNGT